MQHRKGEPFLMQTKVLSNTEHQLTPSSLGNRQKQVYPPEITKSPNEINKVTGIYSGKKLKTIKKKLTSGASNRYNELF